MNLKSLHELSKKHKFDVVIIYMPHVHNIYKLTHPNLNEFLEKWYSSLRKFLLEKSDKYEWRLVDLDKLFLNH